MAGELPDQITPAGEVGQRLAVKQGTGDRVTHVDALAAPEEIEVDAVEGEAMWLTVGQVDVDG